MNLQDKNTRIQISKKTAESLKKLAIAKKESYDEIINRVMKESKELRLNYLELKEQMSGVL